MPLLRKKFVLKQANFPDRVSSCFTNEFHGYNEDMPKSLQKFTELLNNEKDEDGAGLKAAKEIVAELKRQQNDIPHFRNLTLQLPQLNEFLFSTELNPPIDDKVHHDMDAPLSHTSFTLASNPTLREMSYRRYSILPIIDALKQGVRVVELDLFPYGKDDICVRSRWYLVSPLDENYPFVSYSCFDLALSFCFNYELDRKFEKHLELQECLDAIKEHAFTPTKGYPVIITFNDGLKPDLQSKATQMIDQTFGDIVYYHDPHSLEEFPSPAQLQNKILISRRAPKDLLCANDDENGVEVRQESTDQNYQSHVSFHAVEPGGMLRKALTDKAKNIQRPGWYEKDVISFTQSRFLRTRPKHTLLSNASYKPQRAWMHGAQMIALCRQEDEEILWLMQGMFRANGGCGYVKKPNFLLNACPTGVFYPTENPVVVKTLKVKINMGDGWIVDFKKRIGRLSKPDLYVRISIAGVPHDEKIMKTTVKHNEWSPTWGEEFTFPLTYPDLALLSIEVYDHEVSNVDGFGSQTCLPVCELRQGIRAVPLYNEKGEACRSTMLLMRFKWS